ncbi:hypothetical protein LR48_Vigan02g127200 [Vigna angularis]|uniref:Uncharacterized protein n=1 Tax=Phaseolus angularis TaxID=3914 RepID=A0A0L9TXK2_PHAAN|nr:hypothetical protein LR48_Vigan02g127200 [Vigna angularis]
MRNLAGRRSVLSRGRSTRYRAMRWCTVELGDSLVGRKHTDGGSHLQLEARSPTCPTATVTAVSGSKGSSTSSTWRRRSSNLVAVQQREKHPLKRSIQHEGLLPWFIFTIRRGLRTAAYSAAVATTTPSANFGGVVTSVPDPHIHPPPDPVVLSTPGPVVHPTRDPAAFPTPSTFIGTPLAPSFIPTSSSLSFVDNPTPSANHDSAGDDDVDPPIHDQPMIEPYGRG